MQKSDVHILRRLGRAVLHAVAPPVCPLCGGIIEEGEWVCECCERSLESAGMGIRHDGVPDAEENSLARLFWMRLPVERAASVLRYRVDNPVSALLMHIKYHNRPRLARKVGRWMAERVGASGVFEGVDAIVPMPLTPGRFRERGYNQSELLALGVSDVTGIPVRADVMERTRFTQSQTRLEGLDRLLNVRGAFCRTEAYEEACRRGEGLQHPLLLDDVITTGASMSALGEALEAPCLNILSLALAGVHPLPLFSDARLKVEQERETTRAHVIYKEPEAPMTITYLNKSW